MLGRLKLRIRRQRPDVREYSIAAAAQQLGVSTETLRNLEKRGVLRPRRIERSGAAPLRVYTDEDLQKVLNHYAVVGGVRTLPKK